MNTLAALFLIASNLTTPDERLLDAISSAESDHNPSAIGDSGKALSAYQLHQAAWDDANEYRIKNGLNAIPRYRWREPDAARAICSAYCSLIIAQLKKAKQPVEPMNIYSVYTYGFGNYKSVGFDPNRLPKHKKQALARFLSRY